MFCHKCGSEMKSSDRFCTKCGESVYTAEKAAREASSVVPVTKDKWWQRLLKVIYIIIWLQVLWIVPVVWSVNSTDYTYYGGQYHTIDTTGSAFWYSILAIIIFVVVVRLIKITTLYIALGQKPQWHKQFKRLF